MGVFSYADTAVGEATVVVVGGGGPVVADRVAAEAEAGVEVLGEGAECHEGCGGEGEGQFDLLEDYYIAAC